MPGPEVLFPDSGFSEISIAVTTRLGGVSESPFTSFNLASHVKDNQLNVDLNRRALEGVLPGLMAPVWLNQVHGNDVVKVAESLQVPPSADASITAQASLPLAILTADCLPIVLWNEDRTQVAALHAGWRGLANGIIAKTISCFLNQRVYALIGPGIGPCHYEIDEVVRTQFSSNVAFTASKPGHYYFDLVAEASRQLEFLGVNDVRSLNICTACDDRFYSYRRDGETGRFATLIWRQIET
tara:strand:- start:6437 stop:7159 length:723 start_codon:yes stop_codon:yes gene_type:complete